jgi:hypothetical protein
MQITIYLEHDEKTQFRNVFFRISYSTKQIGIGIGIGRKANQFKVLIRRDIIVLQGEYSYS